MIATDMDVRLFDISADGRHIAWVSEQEPRRIYVRSMESGEVRALPETEGAINASVEFSPDGSEVAYIKEGDLWTTPLDGGLGQRLLSGKSATDLWDFDWAPDGSLLISIAREGIFRLGAPGEELELLHAPGEDMSLVVAWVRALPNPRRILFAAMGAGSLRVDLFALALDDAQATPRRLVEAAGFGVYAPTGHLVYFSEGDIQAAEFDPDALTIKGVPRPVVPDVQGDWSLRMGEFAFADNGTLVYLPEQHLHDWRLAWMSTDGTTEFLELKASGYSSPRTSRLGDRFAVLDGGRVYVNDMEGTGLRALSAPDHQIRSSQAWSHDDAAIIFVNYPATGYVQETTIGSNAEELFSEGTRWLAISDVSPDGTSMLISERLPRDVFRILLFDVDTRELKDVTLEGVSEKFARFSPDGRWMAYVSNEEGEAGVFAREIANGEIGRSVQVSPGEGWYPVWSREGDEIFYKDGGGQRLLAVSFRDEPEIRIGEERVVFDWPDLQTREPGWLEGEGDYDIGPDGRFLFVAREPIREMQVNVTLNWFEELKRLVPTGGSR